MEVKNISKYQDEDNDFCNFISVPIIVLNFVEMTNEVKVKMLTCEPLSPKCKCFFKYVCTQAYKKISK